MSTDICRNCGEEIDSNYGCEACDIAPDNYVRPGSDTLMYVNAYSITRHYGGPEEGGWWFNHRQPIASIPIKAVSHEHHDSSCWTCNRAAQGTKDDEGNPIKPCKWGFHLVPDEAQVETFKTHLETLFADVTEGNIYSVLGGAELCVSLEEEEAAPSPRPHYE